MKTIDDLNKELYNASENNNLETVKYLVKKGATNLNGALQHAAYKNNLEMVKYLVEKGATDLNKALSYASKNNNWEIVKYLQSIINKKANSNWFQKISDNELMKESFNYGKATDVAIGTILVGVLAMAPFLGKNKKQVQEEILNSNNPVQIYENMKDEIITIDKELPKQIFDIIEKVDEKIEQESNVRKYKEKDFYPDKAYKVKPNITVARIIYSEASPKVSNQERELVASVIMNRRGHRGFGMGKLNSMEDVVVQENAFEALNDPKNKNWKASETPETLPNNAKHAWQHSLQLSTSDFKPISGPSGNPLVYYHDKSIKLPKSWNNKYWGVTKELETKYFLFYSVYEK